ncbi:MAG: heterocyst differentiation control protein, partial [Cyanobacteria bacterium J06626_18]
PQMRQAKYPWEPGMSRLREHDLTPKEQEKLEAQLPEDTPPACLLDVFEFTDLIKLLHTKSQAEFPLNRRMALSEALTEHIKFRLLHSGTVVQVDIPFLSIPTFALVRNHYTPRGQQERVFTMLDDVARVCKLLQGWVVERSDTFRALEVFDVDSDRREEALEELDRLLQAWADKYHKDGGHPMILQLAAGTRDPGDA